MGLVMDSDLLLAPAADTVPAPAPDASMPTVVSADTPPSPVSSSSGPAEPPMCQLGGSSSSDAPMVTDAEQHEMGKASRSAQSLDQPHGHESEMTPDADDNLANRRAESQEELATATIKNGPETQRNDDGSDEIPNDDDDEDQQQQVHCLCQRPDNRKIPMLMCDACNLWCHIDCVGVEDIDHYEDNPDLKWFCPFCTGHVERPSQGPLSKYPSRAPSPNSLAAAELQAQLAKDASTAAASAAAATNTKLKTGAKRARRTSTTSATAKRKRTQSATTTTLSNASKKRVSSAPHTGSHKEDILVASSIDAMAAHNDDNADTCVPKSPDTPANPIQAPPTHSRTTRASARASGAPAATTSLTLANPAAFDAPPVPAPTSPTSPTPPQKSPLASPRSTSVRPPKRRASDTSTDAPPSALGLKVQIPSPTPLTQSPSPSPSPAHPLATAASPAPSGPLSPTSATFAGRRTSASSAAPPSRSSSTHSLTTAPTDDPATVTKRPAKTCARTACDKRLDSTTYAPYCSTSCKTLALAAAHQRSASTPTSPTATHFGSAVAGAPANPLVTYQRLKLAQDGVDAAERKTRDNMRKFFLAAVSGVFSKPPTDQELAAVTDDGPEESDAAATDANKTRTLSAPELQALASALEAAVYDSVAPPPEQVQVVLPGHPSDEPTTYTFRTTVLSGTADANYRVAIRKLVAALKNAKSDRLHAKLRRGQWTATDAVLADPVEYSTETAREYERARMQMLAQTVRESRDDQEVLVKKTHKGEVEVHRAAAGGLEDERDVELAKAVAAAAARRADLDERRGSLHSLQSPTASATVSASPSVDSLVDSDTLRNTRRVSQVGRSSSLSALAAGPLVVAEDATTRSAGEAVSKLPNVADDVDAMMHGVAEDVVGQVVDLTGEEGAAQGETEAGAKVAKLPMRADHVVDMLMDADDDNDDDLGSLAKASVTSQALPKVTADSMLFDEDEDEDDSFEPSIPASSSGASDSNSSSLFKLFQGGNRDGEGQSADTDDDPMQGVIFSSPARSPTPDAVDLVKRAQDAATAAEGVVWNGNLVFPTTEQGRSPVHVRFVQVGGRKLSGATLRDQWTPSYFAPEMRIDGRLSARTATSYVCSLREVMTREVFVFEVQADDSKPENAQLLETLFNEHYSHGKVAVAVRHEQSKPSHSVYLKDLYLYPLKPDDSLPEWCRTFDNQVSGLRTSNVILGVMVGITDQMPPPSSMPPPPGLPSRSRDLSSSSATWSPRDSGRDAYRIHSPNKGRESSAWSPQRHRDSPGNSSNGSHSHSGTPTAAATNTSSGPSHSDPWDAWNGNATPRRDNPSAMSPPAAAAGALSTPPYTAAGNATPLYNQQQQSYGLMGAAPPATLPPTLGLGGSQPYGLPAAGPPALGQQWVQPPPAAFAAPPGPVIAPGWTPELIAGLQAIPGIPTLDLTQPPIPMHFELLAAFLRHQHGAQVQQQSHNNATGGYQGYNPYQASRRW